MKHEKLIARLRVPRSAWREPILYGPAPAREIDGDIFEILGGEQYLKARKRAAEPCGAPEDVIMRGARLYAPYYTASIEAALSLFRPADQPACLMAAIAELSASDILTYDLPRILCRLRLEALAAGSEKIMKPIP